jgi:hypothetical protein
MEPTTLTLLRALVTAADDGGDASSLLHDDVVLHRLDGTPLEGRDAVVDAIVTRGHEVRLSVSHEREVCLVVALEVDAVPGKLLFHMRASAREGRLVEIWMEPSD